MSTSILSSARTCRSGFPLNRCHCPFVKGKWPVMELMIELDFAWNISYYENLLMNWNINLFVIKMENDMHTLLMFQVALYLCFQLKMHLSRTALHQAACWFHQVYLVKGRLLISINIQSPFWIATCPPDLVRYNYPWYVRKKKKF